MRDPLDDTLAEAGAFLKRDSDLDGALSTLAEARASESTADASPVKPRRRRRLAPVLAIGVTLAVAGAGAVAANQWGPWTYVTDEDTDLVVARDWNDVNGTYLGSCESRMTVKELTPATRDVAKSYLDALDLNSVVLDVETVAGLLNSVGRIDELGSLIRGADASNLDLAGGSFDPDFYSNARILHTALTMQVHRNMVREIVATVPEADRGELVSAFETKCTTDPDYAVDQ